MKKFFFRIFLLISFCSLSTAQENRILTITNKLDDAIYYLYLSPAEESDWGEDYLGDEILEVYESISITLPSSGLYNLMAEDESEKSYRIDGIDLNKAEALTVSNEDFLPFGGRNPVQKKLRFNNNTGEDIYYLYVSSTNSMYWGEDILNDEILSDGDTYTVELPIDSDYPRHDLLAEGEDGSSYEIPDQDLLILDEFSFSQDNLADAGDDYDDYDDDYYDDEGRDEAYLEGYRAGFREAWTEAYKQGFEDAMEDMPRE